MKAHIAIFCVIVSAGCSQHVAGISEWDTVLAVANSTIIEGKSERFLSSLDLRGIPSEKAAQLQKYFRSSWKGVPSHLKLVSRKVVSVEEAENLRLERRKDWPEEMKVTATKWGVVPDRVIMYEFSGNDSSVVWSLGAFKKDGAWFFTASFLE